MLRALTLSNFKINFRDFEKNKDYNMELYFEPKTIDEEVFGHALQSIVLPFDQGLVDTTILQKDYDCIVFYDDEETGTAAIKDVKFKRKLKMNSKNITPEEEAKLPQIIDKRVDSQFRKIASPSGDSYINISDDIIELVSGETKFTISKDQISTYCEQVDYNLPKESKGGLFKESGILRFLPKCFMPPFALPDFLPNIDVIFKISKTLEIVGNLVKALDELEEKSV